jgi:hypothetical protein
MNEADRVYGSRSGIQKGIRRGDLDLVHTCFETLWQEKSQRNWLMWRAATLVTEDAWQMIGELAELLKSKSKEKEDWRKFIYRLCFATKSKDACGLWFGLNRGVKFPEGHVEVEEAMTWRGMAEEDDQLRLSQDIYETYSQDAGLTDYAREGMRVMFGRSKMGGMLGDRLVCLSGMLLISIRGIDKDEIMDDIKSNASRWKEKNGRSKPQIVELPWYAFDMHTQAGKIASNIFMKHSASKYNIEKVRFEKLWFHMESAKIPKEMIRIVKEPPALMTCFDTAWWLPFVAKSISFNNYTPRTAINIWKTKMRDDIKGAVFWILKKREENG